MKTVFKYLKPYLLPVILSISFLVGQVYCELSLPNLMSDIVNTGIQLGGIETGAPEAISADAHDLLAYFMDDASKDVFDASYKAVKAGTDSSLKEKYPESANKDIYVLDTDDTAKVDEAYSNATYAFTLFLDASMKNTAQAGASGDNSGAGTASSGSNMREMSTSEISEMYKILPMLQGMPDGALNPYIEKSHSDNSLLSSQVGTTFTSAFLTELGVDISDVQHDYILRVGGEMLLVALLSVICAISVGYIVSRVAAGVSRTMRRDIFNKVNEFSSAELDKFSTASLITRNTNDVQQIQNFITMGLKMMMFAPLMGIGSIVMALGKSLSLAWIIGVAVLVIIGILLVIMSIAMPKFKALQTLVDRLNLVSREELSGLMVIRAFGNEGHEEKRFDKANRDLTYTTRFVQRTIASLMPTVQLVMSLINIAIVWFGAKAISASTLQIGDMMAFLQYAMHIMISFVMLSMIFILVPRASVSAKRIQEVLECEVTIKDKPDAKALKSVDGKVEFENVSFRYANADEDVISDISFVAEPGQTTAFIGSTGSGKSTLINLIPRFYDVTAGSIKIDGTDIRDIVIKDLRNAIGYIPQKGILFSGTIESNVKYGNDTDDITEALKVAQALDFVQSKEEGVNSPIAQGATNVSGGQKQRLSIARALAKKPPIYIFDDSFSALDFKTDAALRAALSEYTGKSTVLIVAQRVSTIMNAEQIIVLDEGKMVGKGTHAELLASCPQYREICESQLSKEELL